MIASGLGDALSAAPHMTTKPDLAAIQEAANNVNRVGGCSETYRTASA